MASLFSSPDHKAKVAYNGFDMSKLVSFSSTTGELRPIYFDVLQPGDKVRMSSELRTRTMPLVTPVMCEIKEYIEWFFVPFDQMYHRFGEWFNGISDNKSSLYTTDPSADLPYFSASALTSILRGCLDGSNDSHDRFAFTGTFLRVMEDLGIPISWIDSLHLSTSQGNSSWPVALSPFIAGAYQKIYQDFYRITERESVDVRSFNFDDHYVDPVISDFDRFKRVFGLRYRPRRRDFFSSLYTSPLFGQTQIGSDSNVDLTKSFNQWLIGSSSIKTVDPLGNIDTVNPTSTKPEYFAVSNLPLQLSPTNIRTSFAVQKLLAITQRTAKRVDKQQLAHFGVDMRDGLGSEVVFIGRQEQSIKIGDVISTSDTANGLTGAPLGQLAGKGYGYGKSNTMNYVADRPGVLMAIYSAEPLYDYPAYGLDKLNQIFHLNDFPRPEFDNLGMQPLFGSQLYLTPDPNGSISPGNSSIQGWQYRWSEWKTKYNVVTGAMRLGRTLDQWKVQFSRDFSSSGPTLPFFYVSPSELDICVAANYSFNMTMADSMRFSTDPLIHECFFDVKKSSKMSTYGLESL